jgi:hypothetical protein
MVRLKWIPLILPLLAGCAADFEHPVQTGQDRFTMYGPEAEVAGRAQDFCHAKGFKYAQTYGSHYDDYGQHTRFFCMRDGEVITDTSTVNLNVHPY